MVGLKFFDDNCYGVHFLKVGLPVHVLIAYVCFWYNMTAIPYSVDIEATVRPKFVNGMHLLMFIVIACLLCLLFMFAYDIVHVELLRNVDVSSNEYKYNVSASREFVCACDKDRDEKRKR